MSTAENFAFLLPLFQLTFGIAFLIVARWGSRPARMWGIGYVLLACAYCAPAVLEGAWIEAAAVVSDALFLAAFFFLGQALLARFGRRSYALPQIVVASLVLAASAYAVIVEGSLRAELILVDLGCASMLAFPLLLVGGRVRGSIDKALVGLTGLVIADTLVRNAVFVLSVSGEAGLESYTSSSYAFFQQVSATALGPVFALTALAAVTLDVLGVYRDAAENDPLTGLLNRRGFERAALAFEDGSGRSGAVVVCDIDHFKRINDAFGHVAGDRVIAGFAALLRDALPEGGFAARFGGEEFVAFLPNHGDAEALGFANAVRLTLFSHDGSTAGIEHRTTASFGVARPAPGDHSLYDAIARADKALYAAKAAGRNCVRSDGDRPPRPLVLHHASAA